MSNSSIKKEHFKVTLNNLAMDIAVNEQKRFDLSKGPDEIVRLLKHASDSVIPEVQQGFKKVGDVVTPGHRRFFEDRGIVFTQAATMSNSSATTEGDKDATAGKKRIVYRGQVKWV